MVLQSLLGKCNEVMIFAAITFQALRSAGRVVATSRLIEVWRARAVGRASTAALGAAV